MHRRTGAKTARNLGGMVFVAMAAMPTLVYGQSIAGQSVADRPRPDYDALGIELGGYKLLPSITASVEATDNYRATSTNKQGDVYAIVQPEIALRSNWSRHRLEVRAYVAPTLHARLTDENTTQFGATAAGTYDVSRDTSFRADLTAARFVESRSSLGAFQGTLEPVRYDLFRSGVGLSHSIADLRLTATAGAERRRYSDVRLATAGGLINQSYRDVRVLTFGGSAQYDLRNGVGLIASGQYDTARYDFRPGTAGFVNGVDLNRNSYGFSIQGGVTLELSRLIFGTIQVGYLRRNYQDPRLKNVGGLGYSADILWNATALTSMRFRASRSVEDTSAQQIAGNTRDDFRVRVDHELYRYVLLNADAGYGTFRPNGPGIGGSEYTIGAGGRYLIDRRWSLIANLRYSGRDSSSAFLRYRAITGSLGVRFQF
jgi:hypothetical protein